MTGEREQAALDRYVELILAMGARDPALAFDMARKQAPLAETVRLPPFAAIVQTLADRAPDAALLRGILKPFVAAGPFDQDYYLGRYSDLKKAATAGTLRDARLHFVERGYFEGRSGHPDD